MPYLEQPFVCACVCVCVDEVTYTQTKQPVIYLLLNEAEIDYRNSRVSWWQRGDTHKLTYAHTTHTHIYTHTCTYTHSLTQTDILTHAHTYTLTHSMCGSQQKYPGQ